MWTKPLILCIMKAPADTGSVTRGAYRLGRRPCAAAAIFAKWCAQNGIPLQNNQVDIGVRVELPSMVWDDFSHKIYEPKIWYRSKQYGDVTRMFCFNERGQVVVENTAGRAHGQRPRLCG